MKENIKIPSLGVILNEAIQLMKSDLAAKKPITQAAFHNYIDSRIEISSDQKDLKFLSNFDIDLNGEPSASCYEELINLVVIILDAIGLVENGFFNLISNYDHKTLEFIDINETVTPQIFDLIDIDNRFCLWLIGLEMNNYTQTEFQDGCLGNTNRIKNYLFGEYSRLNHAAYGECLDPLLTHILTKCKKALSLILSNDEQPVVKEPASISRTDILEKINKLTPLAFEKFTLLLLSSVLKKENIKADVSYQHTGQTADGGIDGNITVKTRLQGIQEYCIQCKLYSKNIGVKPIREFLGTLAHFRHYQQGYFVTNASFSKEVIIFSADKPNIVLIGGEGLVDLMIEYEIGIEKKNTAEVLKFDVSFFKNL